MLFCCSNWRMSMLVTWKDTMDNWWPQIIYETQIIYKTQPSWVFCLGPCESWAITEESFCHCHLATPFVKVVALVPQLSSQLHSCDQMGHFNFHVNELSSIVASQFLDFWVSCSLYLPTHFSSPLLWLFPQPSITWNCSASEIWNSSLWLFNLLFLQALLILLKLRTSQEISSSLLTPFS